jgi:hypothetical protein
MFSRSGTPIRTRAGVAAPAAVAARTSIKAHVIANERIM